MTGEEREELVRLLRENRVLRMERDLLSRAAAFFAKENVLPRKRRSRSSMERKPRSPSRSCVTGWAFLGPAIARGVPAKRTRRRGWSSTSS